MIKMQSGTGRAGRRTAAAGKIIEANGLPDLNGDGGPDQGHSPGQTGTLTLFSKMRGRQDDLPQKWWFASRAIPLIAATIGPLANVLSIASLVTTWRVSLPNDGILPEGADNNGVGIADPKWEIVLNAVSLASGFAGNLFLLVNFTGRVRYIVALPMSIVLWILSSGILIAILICMQIYAAPNAPGEIYSQGFWHAVLASIMYFVGSLMLMVNLLGYFLGHYPQQFDLVDHERTLILQTMMFFFWMAAGAGVFCGLEGWTYTNALYYADISILTIGFGDIAPLTNAGRGFLFVFVLVGITFLGLVIGSISRFIAAISADKIVKSHQSHVRASTFSRTVSNEQELRERLGLPPRNGSDFDTRAIRRESLGRNGRIEIVGRNVTFRESRPVYGGGRGGAGRTHKPLSRDEKVRARGNPDERRRQRRQKLLLLREEKDRFEAMREIQEKTRRFKQYWATVVAFLAFGVLWGVGALIFMLSEARLLGMGYFDALYFCFVSLLTIGYGDYSPKSNAGKPFFIVWSLIAVPIITAFIQEMSNTVVSAVNRGTNLAADYTVMPKKGVLKDFLDQHRGLRDLLGRMTRRHRERKRLSRGFELQNPDMEAAQPPDQAQSPEDAEERLRRLASPPETEHDIAKQLTSAIKHVAHDIRASPPKKYTYEQWVRFTRLIRFSVDSIVEERERDEEGSGLVEWDWIGEDSPMLADVTEAEWVLDRLCESLDRYTRRQAIVARSSDER